MNFVETYKLHAVRTEAARRPGEPDDAWLARVAPYTPFVLQREHGGLRALHLALKRQPFDETPTKKQLQFARKYVKERERHLDTLKPEEPSKVSVNGAASRRERLSLTTGHKKEVHEWEMWKASQLGDLDAAVRKMHEAVSHFLGVCARFARRLR